MKVRQCDRCKKILSQENKFFSYSFDIYNDNWASKALEGDFCYSCYKKFEKFVNQEEPYDN